MSDNKYNRGRALRIAVRLMMLGLLLVGGAGAIFLNNENLTVKDSSDPSFWKIMDEANDSNYESNQIFYKNQDQSKNISISPPQSPQSQNINNIINSFETFSNNTKNQTENRGLFLLKNGFAIRIIAIDQETFPHKLWLALEKNEIKIDDAILNSGEEYSYKNDFDEIKLKIEGFVGNENSIVFLKNIYQSSNGEILLNYENSTLYPSNSISSFQVTIDRVNLNFLISGQIGLKQTASMGFNAVRQITVDDDGPADYSLIQQAIDEANNGDTIYVKNGTYLEHLMIVKNNLTIIGENQNSTIIDGGGDGDVIVLMGANNNTI